MRVASIGLNMPPGVRNLLLAAAARAIPHVQPCFSVPPRDRVVCSQIARQRSEWTLRHSAVLPRARTQSCHPVNQPTPHRRVRPSAVLRCGSCHRLRRSAARTPSRDPSRCPVLQRDNERAAGSAKNPIGCVRISIARLVSVTPLLRATATGSPGALALAMMRR